jgi:hypothetical protein
MKKLLLPAFCFFALQIASCSQPIIDAQPGTTKFSIKNDFRVQLQDIRWNGNNFGDISPGETSEKKVSDGQGYMYFILKDKEYETQTIINVEKYLHNNFNIHKNLFVIDENLKMLTLEEALKSFEEDPEELDAK